MVITNNDQFAHTSNADCQTISGYAIEHDGSIADTFPIEESLRRNSRCLWVLDLTLSGFRVENNGQLRPVVDPSSINVPFSAIGQTAD